MAIAFDAASAGTLNTATWSHTVTGSNPELVVGIFDDHATTSGITAITYNGVAMTLILTGAVVSGKGFCSLWYLDNPATGSHTISLTVAGGTNNYRGSAISLTGVGTLDVSGTGNGSPASDTITTAANAWIVSAAIVGGGATTITWTNATDEAACAGDGLRMADTAGPVTGSVTTSAAHSYTTLSVVSASFTVFSGGGGGTNWGPWVVGGMNWNRLVQGR